MCCAGSILFTNIQFPKNGVKLSASCYNDSNTYGIIFKKSSKRIQIPIKCLIFTVPLQIERYPALYIIDLMGTVMNLTAFFLIIVLNLIYS